MNQQYTYTYIWAYIKNGIAHIIIYWMCYIIHDTWLVGTLYMVECVRTKNILNNWNSNCLMTNKSFYVQQTTVHLFYIMSSDKNQTNIVHLLFHKKCSHFWKTSLSNRSSKPIVCWPYFNDIKKKNFSKFVLKK